METEVKTIPQIRQVYYDTYANLPTAGLKIGALGYATDRKVFYRWSGAAWQAITIHSSSGATGAKPAAADLPNGSLYFDTTLNTLDQVQAGAWVSLTASSPLIIIRKTANQVVNNTEVLVDVADLVLPVLVNEVWDIEAFLLCMKVGNQEIDVAFTLPAGGTIAGYTLGDVGQRTGADTDIVVANFTVEKKIYCAQTTPSVNILRLTYVGGGNAGNVQLQFAQNVAEANNTLIAVNSRMICRKLT